MLLISFVVVMLSVILCRYVCSSSLRLRRLLELIIQANKSCKSTNYIDRLQGIPGFAHVTTQQHNNATADVALS